MSRGSGSLLTYKEEKPCQKKATRCIAPNQDVITAFCSQRKTHFSVTVLSIRESKSRQIEKEVGEPNNSRSVFVSLWDFSDKESES
jgi:hypothetical protein